MIILAYKDVVYFQLDLLWNKYGEVKGQLAVLESQESVDRRKIEAIQQQLTTLQEVVGDIEGEITQIADDLKSILETDQTQDDDTNTTENPVWKEFPFTMKRGSVQMNASYIVLTVDVQTTSTFSYIWFENGLPILDNDLFIRVHFAADNVHTLELRGNQSSAIRNGNKVISLQIQNQFHGLTFQFHATKHSFVRVHDYPLSYRIGPVHEQNNVTSGYFEIRSKILPNRDFNPSVNFFGLNGSDIPYECISAGSWLGSDGEPMGPGRILNVTSGSIEGDIYKVTYELLKMVHDNGGILTYTLTITRFDDVFNSVKYVMHDSETFRQGVATLPEGSLVYLRDLFPRYSRLCIGESNLLYCSAMGNPRPRMAILKLNRDGHETSTGYRSVVSNREYITTVMLVIKPTVPEIGNISFVCAATSNGIERRLSLPTRIVVPPKFLKYEVHRGEDESVIVKLFVKHSVPPKPAISCRENDDWGDFIWGKSHMYTSNETSTRSGYIVTFNVNMAATTTPPTKFICQVFNVNGIDRIIVPIHF
ncbi:uncharacterized protein LOC117326815 [Pecten maximus]|uniref:uncharacterized protein LOC117326815 n=1 Tax=Pecten maximus TaxID=6579 RepID=UPI0014585E0F|nr:uncharacterized protein LOC117326815 [Pecten maximus]